MSISVDFTAVLENDVPTIRRPLQWGAGQAIPPYTPRGVQILADYFDPRHYRESAIDSVARRSKGVVQRANGRGLFGIASAALIFFSQS